MGEKLIMKQLRCDSCGAALKNYEAGMVNVKCEYCGTVLRVVGAGSEQYNTENIVNQILELGVARTRKDRFNNTYKNAKNLIEQHKYTEANNLLNGILAEDQSQARAWYYKSILPILEQESVLYHGHYINIHILSQITKDKHVKSYLSSCGLPRLQHAGFMRFYGSMDFLYEQQLKFLDKAVEYASTPERKEFFINQKDIAINRQKKKLLNRSWGNFFLITLLLATIVGVVVVGGIFIG